MPTVQEEDSNSPSTNGSESPSTTNNNVSKYRQKAGVKISYLSHRIIDSFTQILKLKNYKIKTNLIYFSWKIVDYVMLYMAEN